MTLIADRQSPAKRARRSAHEAFDPIWMSGTMTRSEAYRWLAKQMRLP